MPHRFHPTDLPQPIDPLRPQPDPLPGPSPLPNPVAPRPVFTGNEEIELLSAAEIGRPIPLAYGLHLVGGKIFFQHEVQTGADKGKTLLFAALGVGEWNKRRAFFVNGKLVDHTDTSKFHFHPGKAGEVGGETDPATPNQKTCSFWPSNFTQQPNFPGIAYVSMKLDPDIEAPGPGFQVVGIYETLLVRIFDNVGNQTSYAFSSNPAWISLDLHIRSWIAPDKTNGETLSAAEKDEIDFQAFKDWADDSDFVTPQGTKRWEAHYVLTEETNLMRALELSHLLGRAYTLERNAKIAPFMDKARAPVAIVKAAHIAEGSFNLGRRSLRDAANRIEVKYRDLDSGKGAGTISTTGVNVTGNGTDFTKVFRPGEPCDLRDGAQAGEVNAAKSVASATSMVLETAFSVDQSGAAYGNPAQDFAVKTHFEEDTILQGQIARPITAKFDLGNSIPERAERIATFLLDRTTKLTRQTGYRILMGQASALEHLAGDVLTSPDDVSFDPANTRDFEALEVTVQPDGSVEVAGQEFQDIFSDAASAPPAQETSLPPRRLAGVSGGFQIGAVFAPDQLNGASNLGEIDFNPLPDRDHTFWRLPDGTAFTFPAGSQFVSQATLDSYIGDVFLIFSQQLCNSERGLAAFQDSHLLEVRHNAGQWQYDNNTTWVNFTPLASDIAIFRAKRNGANWAGVPMEYLGVSLLSQRVLSTLVEYSDGTPIDDLQPGETGANVTETRTSNNTSNVGGSTAADTDTGATRGRNALDSIFKLSTGTTLQTVAQLGDAHDRAVAAIDATNIIVAAGINFARAYTNKNQDNIPDTATRFAAVEAGANKTETRTAALIAGQGALATKSAVNLATAEVLNKTLANIVDAAGRFAAVEAGANKTETRTAALIAGQGALATKNAVDLATVEVLNKTLANIVDAAGRFAAVEAGANKTETRTAALIAGQGALATKNAVDLATVEVLNKTAGNIAETGARKWLPTLNRIFASQAQKDAAMDVDGNLLLKNIENSVGVTSSPTKNDSTFATIPEMTKTFTSKGGKVLLIFDSVMSLTAPTGTVLEVRFVRDSTVIGKTVSTQPISAGQRDPTTFVRVDTGAAAGSHEWKVEWRRSFGSGTHVAVGVQRELQAVELT